MAATSSKIDPAWAWAPYQPDARRPWNVARAAHLMRRAGFGADWRQLTQAVDMGPAKTIGLLLRTAGAGGPGENAPSDPPAFVDDFDRRMDRVGTVMLGAGDPQRLSAWWLYRMQHTPAQLLEKTTLFWHGHFATSAAKVADARMMLDQNALLRDHALGRFEAMVQAISRDPAMLVWLDSTTNRRSRPNENYARELMELFCLGAGNYTEDDIKQVARAFTGWEITQKRFRFNQFHHDTGVKTFLGHSGPFNGDEAVRIVLAQPAATRFIVHKLLRFFVVEEPQPTDELIEPLAQQLRDNDFTIGPVIERMLSSNLFFSEHAMGRKVRSPVDLGVGLLRSLEATTELFALAEDLGRLGQAVFFPPNVKGWDGGRTWIDSSTLLGRANLVHRLMLTGDNPARFEAGSLQAVAEKYGVTSTQDMVDWLLQLLVAVPVPDDVRRSLVDLANAGGGDAGLRQAVHAIATLPEFQLM